MFYICAARMVVAPILFGLSLSLLFPWFGALFCVVARSPGKEGKERRKSPLDRPLT